MRLRTSLAASAGCATLALSGCSSAQEPTVEDAAARFYQALQAGDGVAACSVLAPTTRSEVEKSARRPCPDALVEEDIPRVQEPSQTSVYGTMAQVRYAGETTFLARFRGGWKVLAAGCRDQRGRPYDCQVQGG